MPRILCQSESLARGGGGENKEDIILLDITNTKALGSELGISLFFNFFSKMICCIFYQVNLTGSGLFK